jgi:hypothetical protein
MAQYYEIRLKGHLDLSWSEWLGDMTIIHQANGDTLLTGPIADQAALHGILNQMRDIGIPLISVNPVDSTKAKHFQNGSATVD